MALKALNERLGCHATLSTNTCVNWPKKSSIACDLKKGSLTVVRSVLEERPAAEVSVPQCGKSWLHYSATATGKFTST